MKFLIEIVNGEVVHDFSFTLIESCKYHNWLRNNNDFEWLLFESTPTRNMKDCSTYLIDYIPIGSVEFVIDYLKLFHNKTPNPINIPKELRKRDFLGRRVINGTEKGIVGEKFVKSNDKIKGFTGICTEAPRGNYQISDVISIRSEWRAFVYKNELVGLQNYSGEFDVFPEVGKIKKMIDAYKVAAPIAYTLDVAIAHTFISNKDFNQNLYDNTVVIEVHDFFSCGLYGFADHKVLPYMYSKWFNEFISK